MINYSISILRITTIINLIILVSYEARQIQLSRASQSNQIFLKKKERKIKKKETQFSRQEKACLNRKTSARQVKLI